MKLKKLSLTIKKNNISNSSAEDIFGDEQTFPFVAGLGKNAAHWFQSSWKCRKRFFLINERS